MGEQRLGAIKVTDVVGYSSITSKDEGEFRGGSMGLACLYTKGRREEASKLLGEYLSDPSSAFTSPTLVAMVKFALGESEEATGLLQRAHDEHDGAFGVLPRVPLAG
jgi:hypothetical protein